MEVVQNLISHTDLPETWHNHTFSFFHSTDKLAIIWFLLAVFPIRWYLQITLYQEIRSGMLTPRDKTKPACVKWQHQLYLLIWKGFYLAVALLAELKTAGVGNKNALLICKNCVGGLFSFGLFWLAWFVDAGFLTIAFPDSLIQRAQSVSLDVADLLDSDKSNGASG